MKPAAVPGRLSAQLILNSGVDEDAVHFWSTGRKFQHMRMAFIPKRIVESVGHRIENAESPHVRAIAVGLEVKRRAQIKPDISIEPCLVAPMAERHGAPSTHAKIANMHESKAMADVAPQRTDGLNQCGMPPITVPLQVHDKIPGALGWEHSGASHATCAGFANRARGSAGRGIDF